MARDRKTELRMLLDAEELQSYLQCAFDHFAASLDRPFDFVQASFSNSPIPLDFGGNILKLAIRVMQVWRNKADAQQIFQELSYMVASCIMLDCARQKTRGRHTAPCCVKLLANELKVPHQMFFRFTWRILMQLWKTSAIATGLVSTCSQLQNCAVST